MLCGRLLVIIAALLFPASALAGGGNYVFEGAKPAEQRTVRAALNASTFDWGVVPETVTIHVGHYGVSHSTPGHIWLDRGLLAAGKFAWGTVMDEYAHQVDFFVLGPGQRSLLQQRLGTRSWCYEVAGLSHGSHGCERFASMVAWAYWPSKDNAYRPESRSDEAATMPAAEFRALVATLVAPTSATRTAPTLP